MNAALVGETYTDAFGREQPIAPDVRAAVLAALGPEEPTPSPVAIVRRGERLPAPGELTLEDGSDVGHLESLPPDAPHGYHRLRVDDGDERLIIAGPGRCHLPGALRAWGWAIQLATTRSRGSWGIGDLADLRELGAWSASAGAGFVAVGPLGAPNPGPEPEPSPYYPSTRRFGNPLHLRIEEIPGADALGEGLTELAAAGRALNEDRRVDRRRVAELKMDALERIWRTTDRTAFEAWRAEHGTALDRWGAFVVLSERFGAPPDRFNTAGQSWGLPPFVPGRLRAAAYRPFIETIRAQLRHAGGLRIDHVLGLFRLWWIPSGQDPSRGAYVRSHTDELLEILALESDRAGAVVIGEDLGTVPPGVRGELRRRRLLSTRLALFERGLPATYARHSFAGVTTHDLPTMAGIWNGSDLADQAASGVRPDPEALALLRRRLARAAGTVADAPLEAVITRLHARLAASPPMLVAATLEDAVRVEERPNLPGTVAPQRANWSLALPAPLEEVAADPRVVAMAEALTRT